MGLPMPFPNCTHSGCASVLDVLSELSSVPGDIKGGLISIPAESSHGKSSSESTGGTSMLEKCLNKKCDPFLKVCSE